MENILMLSFNGCTYYFQNTLSENEINLIDNITTKLSDNKKIKNLCEEEILHYFLDEVFHELGINLNLLKINHVFRIMK